MNESRETIQRAIGILEGVMFCAPQKVADAIATAAEMLEAVINEYKNNDRFGSSRKEEQNNEK